jgi:flagellar assembly protein FliH
MSSRVLTGDAARPAERIVWKRCAPGQELQSSGPAPEQPPEPDVVPELRARIAELEREYVLRERNAAGAGFEKGREAGRQEAQERYGAAVTRFAEAAAGLSSLRPQLRHDAEADVVKLAIAIARRVLHRELGADPEAMLGLVKASLEKLDNREVDRVRVNPEDAEAVRGAAARLRPTARLEVVPDGRLQRGAAVFETARGAMDASVETQLEEIERGLIDRLHSKRNA